jgi:hypothetical protein
MEFPVRAADWTHDAMERLMYSATRMSDRSQSSRHAGKRVLLGLAALFLVVWATPPIMADQIDGTVEQQNDEQPTVEPSFEQPQFGPAQDAFGPAQDATPLVFPLPQPTIVQLPEFESQDGHLPRRFVKVGSVVTSGGGQLEKMFGPGWTVQLGVRDWLSSQVDESGFFVDLGAGFTHNARHGGGVVSPGVFHASGDDHDHALAEFFESNLTEARRGFLQAAFGRRFVPDFFCNTERRRVQLTVRAGSRISHAKIWLDNSPTAALQEVIDEHIGHGHDPDGLEFRTDVRDQYTKTYAGIFGVVGIGVMYYDVSWGTWRLGDVALEAELELSNDWIDMPGFDDDALVSFAQLLTVSILR